MRLQDTRLMPCKLLPAQLRQHRCTTTRQQSTVQQTIHQTHKTSKSSTTWCTLGTGNAAAFISTSHKHFDTHTHTHTHARLQQSAGHTHTQEVCEFLWCPSWTWIQLGLHAAETCTHACSWDSMPRNTCCLAYCTTWRDRELRGPQQKSELE
jgi:hypothetical protein